MRLRRAALTCLIALAILSINCCGGNGTHLHSYARNFVALAGRSHCRRTIFYAQRRGHRVPDDLAGFLEWKLHHCGSAFHHVCYCRV